MKNTKTKESAKADRALRNARMEAEEELYNAWMDFFNMDFKPDLTEEEKEAIRDRRWEAYGKACDLLGPEWAASTVWNARKDSGEEE